MIPVSTYAAPTDCPTEQEFRAAIAERAPDASHARGTLHVSIEHDGSRYSGRVVLVQVEGGNRERSVAADDCANLVKALAFVSAVLLDPETLQRSENAPAKAEPTAEAPVNEPTWSPTAPAPSAPSRAWLGAMATTTFALAPRAMFGGSGWFRFAPGGVPFALDVGFVGESTTVERTPGSGHFARYLGRADACALAWESRTAAVIPCVRVDAGLLDASGEIAHPARYSRPWVDVGAGAGLELRVFDPLAIELEGAVLAPLIRDDFYIATNPEVRVFRTGPVGVSASGGAVVRIW